MIASRCGRSDQMLGHAMSSALAEIEAELRELHDKRTAKDEHAAFANGIMAMLKTLRDAGHAVPDFMSSGLNRLVQSAPGVPHRHADLMFTVRSDDPDARRDPAGYVERLKRALPVALVNHLVLTGLKPTPAINRVATAIGIEPADVFHWRKDASRKNKNTDWAGVLNDAAEFVRAEFARLRQTVSASEVREALISRISQKVQAL